MASTPSFVATPASSSTPTSSSSAPTPGGYLQGEQQHAPHVHIYPLNNDQLAAIKAMVHIAIDDETSCGDLTWLPRAAHRLLTTAAALGETESTPSPFRTEEERNFAWMCHSPASRAQLTFDAALDAVSEEQRPYYLSAETRWVARSLIARMLGKVYSNGGPLTSESAVLYPNTHYRAAPPEYSIFAVLRECFVLARTCVEGFDLHHSRDDHVVHARRLILHVLSFDLRVATPYDATQNIFHSLVPSTALREYPGLKYWNAAVQYSLKEWSVDHRCGFGNPNLIGTYLAVSGLFDLLPVEQQDVVSPWGKRLLRRVQASWDPRVAARLHPTTSTRVDEEEGLVQ